MAVRANHSGKEKNRRAERSEVVDEIKSGSGPGKQLGLRPWHITEVHHGVRHCFVFL